ncbi:MAG: hypothetical protein SF066_00335 [Thermoanaerobaculia bacterium]|nr:hypothetical protein [Thermoanaerobaculia bacterium]
MDREKDPPGLALARAISRLSLVVLAVSGTATLLASYSRPQGSTPPPGASCVAIRGVPGPEDLELETRDSGTARLLISSQDRRPDPLPQGAIYGLGASDDRPRRLPLVGRDGCSFHPHGMSLVVHDGKSYLYVINHHDEADTRPGAGCLAGAKDLAKVSSVEVFQVEQEALRFLTRLADPEKLTNPNDLVALPDGTVWVTNPADGFAAVREGLFRRNVDSRLVHFTCTLPPAKPGCPGKWEEGPRFGTYLNGIGERNEGQELFVASTAEGRIYRLETASARAESSSGPEVLAEVAGPDNLSWADATRTRLLVAGHPSLRSFLQHKASARAPSPSQVTELDLASGSKPVFEDDGGQISAASVAVRVGDSWFFGQVFEPFVLRCPKFVGGVR